MRTETPISGLVRNRRHGWRDLRPVVTALVTAALTIGLCQGTANALGADDPIVVTNIPFPTGSIDVSNQGQIVGSTVPAPPADQCVPIDPEHGSVCMGRTEDPVVVNVSGGSDNPIAGGPEATAALLWIWKEAEVATRMKYGVPDDYRVVRYARPEIRAYMHAKILTILDKAAYGVQLSPDEAKTLAFVQKQQLDHDRKLARSAYEEWARWEALGCGYTPPAAPAAVPNPLGLPKDVSDYCQFTARTLTGIFGGQPMPSTGDFQAWGAYRQAHALGLDLLSNPDYASNLNHTIAASAELIAGGAAAAGVVAGAYAAVTFAEVSAAGIGAPLMSSLTPAAIAAGAAVVVGIILVALLVTAISIWKLVEQAQVGANLTQAMNDAQAATDPFGLAQLRIQNAGKQFREGMTPDNLPGYRNDASQKRLWEEVTRWTTVTEDGTVRADPTDIWTDNATTAADEHFMVSGSLVDSISLPQGRRDAEPGPLQRQLDDRHRQ